MCREYKRGRSRGSRAVGGWNRETRERNEKEKEREKKKASGSICSPLREKNVRGGCDHQQRDIYICFPLVRDSLDRALERSCAFLVISGASDSFFSVTHRLYPFGRSRILSPRSRCCGSRARKLETPSSPPLYLFPGAFCKVLFFRNAGPTIVFPRCALSPALVCLRSFNLARVI